jgi:hypothetical protein
MGLNSATISSGDLATSQQYNDLRSDAVSTSSGHVHDGTLGIGSAQFILGVAGAPLLLQNTTDAVSNEVLRLGGGNRATPADNDEIILAAYLDNCAGTQTEFGRITHKALDVTGSSKDSRWEFQQYAANTLREVVIPAVTADDVLSVLGFAQTFTATKSFGANADIAFTGTTGTNDLVLTNGLADALSVTDGSADIIVVDTSTTGNVITFESAVIFNEGSADVDYRFEGANNANLVVLDGGTDSLGLGGAVTTGAFMSITPAAQARDMVSAVGSWLHIPADSQDINAAGNCATIAIGAAIYLGVPTWTSTATGLTLTDSATLHIAGKPIDSSNVTNTREYGLLVESGGLGLGIPGGTTGCLRIAGGSSGVITITTAAAAGTYTLTLPTCNGGASQVLQTDGCGVLSWATVAAITEATACDQEDRGTTNANRYVSPEIFHRHPSAAKIFVKWEQTDCHDFVACTAYNYSSVTDGGGVGDTDHLWATDFSSANYVLVTMPDNNRMLGASGGTLAAGGVTTYTRDGCSNAVDQNHNMMAGFGDH